MPDAPDYKNPGLTEAKNVYPSPSGYYPFWDKVTTGEAVSGTVLGAARFERKDGSDFLCIGTTTDLYVCIGVAIPAGDLDAAVSFNCINSGLTLSVSTSENWAFEQFGSAIYATTQSGGTYYLADIESNVNPFFVMIPAHPKAKAVARMDDFLVYGNLTDIDASSAPTRVRWSAFNNPLAAWGTDIGTQQGFIDMPQHFGSVTGLAGGDVGYILQENATSQFDYTGSAIVFQKVLLQGSEDQSAGCVGHASIASIGGVHYWLSSIGFVKLTGGTIQIISKGRVWDWFLENANTDQLHKVQAAINLDRRCVVWNFYPAGTLTYTKQIIYNWELDQWSNATVAADWFVPTVFNGAYTEGTLRRRRLLAGFVSGTLYQFTGDALAATLETGEFQLEPGRRSFFTSVRTIAEITSGTPSITVKHRNLPGAAKTSTAATAEGPAGYAPFNVDGRFVSVSVSIPAAATWEKASALEIDAIPTGAV